MRGEQIDPLFGVLWELWGGPASGVPQYGQFDPEVQRQAADRLLCAHCPGRPDKAPGAEMLWLLHAATDGHSWPTDIRPTTPPICRTHAELALEWCATLRRGHLAVCVHEAEPIGVMGTLYAHGGPAGPDELVLFIETHRLRYVLARYLIHGLRGATPDELLHTDRYKEDT